jgi:hypothetical protein
MAKTGDRGTKRRRWKTEKPATPPQLVLPQHLRAALGWPVDPDWPAAANRALELCHERYDHGDKGALLDAVEILLNGGSPPWVREAFAAAWSNYRQYEAVTLDEAFGVERPKGSHPKRARERETLRPQIMLRVYELHRQGAPLDLRTFAQVGEELGIDAKTVARIFGEPESDALRELLRKLPPRPA